MRTISRLAPSAVASVLLVGLAACASSGSQDARSSAPAPPGAELQRVSFVNHSKYREPVEAVFSGRENAPLFAQDSFDWVRTRPLIYGAKMERTRFTLYDRPVRARPVEVEIYGGTRRAKVVAGPGRIIASVDVDLKDDALVVTASQDDGSAPAVQFMN
jgi:hypothetical protein